MRVYLDTNILAFLVGQDMGNSISRDVMGVMNDYETILLTSSVCAQELVHLVQIGKVRIENYHQKNHPTGRHTHRATALQQYRQA